LSQYDWEDSIRISQRRQFPLHLGACVVAPALYLGSALPSTAQTAEDLVGTWTKVSDVTIRQDGSRVHSYGPNGIGLAIFDRGGRFSIVNVNPDVPKFASNSRAQGTPEENNAAVLGSLALFGTYSVADKVIFFKVEGSTYPNFTATEQQRVIVSFTGDEITWTLPSSISGRVEVTNKRVK
jgi:hypothetical protein